MRLPNKLSGSGEIKQAINDLIDCLKECRPMESHDTLLERGPLGFAMRPRSSGIGGNSDGPWKLYDKAESCSPGDRRVVLPTHELVTAGLLDEETEVVVKAPAGNYFCQRAVSPVETSPGSGIFRYNAPKWPTETVDDPEATNTYWWLISLYPDTNITCDPDTNEETEIYVNAQPIPVQP